MRGLIAIMNPTEITATTTVLTRYMRPGPSIMRTAARSFVARDIRSPVGRCWKKDTGSVSRCSNSSFLKSYSMWREIAMIVCRMKYLKVPAASEIANRITA